MRYLQLIDDADRQAVLNSNDGRCIVCPSHHPTLGLVIEDTWGFNRFRHWWENYHRNGGQHHVGDEWPAIEPQQTSQLQDVLTLLADIHNGPLLMDELVELLHQSIVMGRF